MNKIVNKIKKIKMSFLSNHRLIEVKDIINGYLVFEDNWVSKNDEYVCDTNHNKYQILDFKEIEITERFKRKISSIKIDKVANIGDLFYIYF